MASLITTIGQVFTGFVGWAGTLLDFFVNNPLLMFFIGMGIVFQVIYAFRALRSSV